MIRAHWHTQPWSKRIALLIILLYAFLAASSELGASLVGQGLDPVWAAARARGRVRIGVDYGQYPFTDIVEDRPRGYDIDLARAIADRLGLDTEFVGSSMDSIYDDLASGKIDIAASALPYAPEQGWRARFSTFYFNAGQVLLVREDSTVTSISDLQEKRVGVTLGSDADSYARNLISQASLFELHNSYDDLDSALSDLHNARLDAVITDNTSALMHMQGYALRIAAALTLEPYVLATPLAAFQLQEKLNRALADLEHEGFFERNGAKWFASPQHDSSSQ